MEHFRIFQILLCILFIYFSSLFFTQSILLERCRGSILLLLFRGRWSLYRRIERRAYDHVLVIEHAAHAVRNSPHHLALIRKTYLHLGGMDVDVDQRSVDTNHQAREGIPMLHQFVPVPFLDPDGNDAALYISAVHIIILKVPVSAGDRRLGDKTCDTDPVLIVFHRQKL